MASWSVLEPPDKAAGSFEAADGSAFVKDGWCWPALLFPPVWLVFRRMWLVFLGWLAVAVLISVGSVALELSDLVVAGIQTLFALWFALEANAMRRWTLLRRGWRFAGIATGVDRVDAEHRFFGRSVDAAVPQMRAPASAAPHAFPATPRAEPIIGLFPEPWDGRR